MIKKYDIVKLTQIGEMEQSKHLDLADYGVVVGRKYNLVNVVFFNAYNKGDYAVAQIDALNLTKLSSMESEQWKEFSDKTFGSITDWGKDSLNPLRFKEAKAVQLISDDKKYAKYGLKKGSVGVVAIDWAEKDYCLVDFSATGLEFPLETMGLIKVKLSDLIAL